MIRENQCQVNEPLEMDLDVNKITVSAARDLSWNYGECKAVGTAGGHPGRAASDIPLSPSYLILVNYSGSSPLKYLIELLLCA